MAQGFHLSCPKCGKEDTMRLKLDDTDVIFCCDCDAEFEAGDIEEIIEEWQKALAWLKTAPEKK